MSQRLNKATNIGIVVNIFLFIIKAAAGIISNSIAIISEAVNSLTDIVSSIAIKYSVHLSKQKPDEKHQFGHGAAEPIAAFIVAVFAFVLGFKIIEESIKRILSPEDINASLLVYLILITTIITKIILSQYQRKIGKIYNSTAIKAASIDSLNDILASSIALVGVIASSLNFKVVDGIAGILVAMFIFKTGYEVAVENLDYLMGKSADDQLIIRIMNKSLKIKGVMGLNDIRSHYVGDKFHIEIHIEVDKNCTTKISHDIGKEVQNQLEEMAEIQKVFVHIDPV
ncbi:MAG: cation diffusion facilitator family transporter [Bacteroidetes bacterium]|nr:cation diffusion facilitator family transporter [Bacteroidota bacterium]